MKKLFFIIAMLVTVSVSAQFSSANLTAAGLTCAMCTRAINSSLEKLTFIESVNPDIKTSTFQIVFKKGKDVNFDQLRSAVEEAGFSVSKLAVKTRFDNLAVKKDAHVQLGGKTFHFLKTANTTLDGEKSVVIVDKNFLNAKEFKKYAASTTMACVNTGKATSCCSSAGTSEGSRVYHVTI